MDNFYDLDTDSQQCTEKKSYELNYFLGYAIGVGLLYLIIMFLLRREDMFDDMEKPSWFPKPREVGIWLMAVFVLWIVGLVLSHTRQGTAIVVSFVVLWVLFIIWFIIFAFGDWRGAGAFVGFITLVVAIIHIGVIARHDVKAAFFVLPLVGFTLYLWISNLALWQLNKGPQTL